MRYLLMSINRMNTFHQTWRIDFSTSLYRVAHLLVHLGGVNLDLGNSYGWLATNAESYCIRRLVSTSDQSQPSPGPRGDGSPCSWKEGLSVIN